jgi:hypothetical protein
MAPARQARAGFRKFSGKISCIARLRRTRAGLRPIRWDPVFIFFLKVTFI